MKFFDFSGIFRPLFSSVFIGVNIDGKVCSVKMLRVKDSKPIESINKDFRTVNNELPIDAIKFIKIFTKKYPFTYVSAMSKTYNQGVVKDTPKEENKDTGKFEINPKESSILDLKNWKIYINNSSIKENTDKYSKIDGLDYLFSPFLLIYNKIEQDLDEKTTLYVLQERNGISLLVADKENIYFGGYFIVENEIDEIGLTQTPAEKVFDDSLFTINDDDENFDDEMKDLDDLDSEYFIDKLNEKLLNEKEEGAKEKVEDIAKIGIITNIIQSSLREFYSNETYESKFIEKILILDTYGMSEQALNYLKENTMIDTHKISFSIPDSLINLSTLEFKKGVL